MIGSLFKPDYDLFLYDVTSTYFEGEAKWIWVMDRGMASEKNFDFLKVRRYILGANRGQLKEHEKELIKTDSKRVRAGLK